jgi:D-isomer specific 2-hydroxyacid dehydrogenase, NAD binding domain
MSICLVYWRNQILYLYTAPLTLETRHLINSETIELMKCGSMLINTARGALIDTGAAVNALKRRDRLWYLGIDVYEEEGPLFFTDLSSTIIQDDVFERCANVGRPREHDQAAVRRARERGDRALNLIGIAGIASWFPHRHNTSNSSKNSKANSRNQC